MMTRLAGITVLLIANLAAGADYERDVKPLLAEKCAACHGALKQESGLRLDAGSVIHEGSDDGKVLVPEDPAGSLMIQRLTTADDDERMPPHGEGERLTEAQIRILAGWIADGASFPDDEIVPQRPDQHWAYQPVTRPDLPDSNAANPIDAFIDAKHAGAGLTPLPPADPRTLLRRVHFDVIGLAPTRTEQTEFLNQEIDAAWPSVVDNLLDREAYGERWGRHWMDVWRYSDWDGFKNNVRGSQRHIWRWRDWIIESLNSDIGYDKMVVAMLAGDEVAPEDPDTLRATGFLARNYHNSNRDIWLDATVEHTAKAFLGMTINCARCHDHKYDPIAQAEYYGFRAIFEPHEVRTERVPGERNLLKDGLVRAFDAKPDAPTHLYVGGNEKLPDKDHPLSPAVPSVIELPFQLQTIELPAIAVFPSLRAFVEKDDIAAARAAVEKARQQLDQADETQTGIARKNFEAKQATRTALQARWAADKAKHSQAEEVRITELAKTAATAERNAAVLQAEVIVDEKRSVLEAAENEPKSKEPKAVDAKIVAAKKELAAAEKKLKDARKAVTRSDSNYIPVGKTYPRTSTGRRLALARWITDERNPLTARVAVNHIWLRHFGEPLVSNPFDFGLRSTKPEFADLLDWLATELIEHDWSMKHLHRLILNSRAWRRASAGESSVVAANHGIDPDNQYFWKAYVRRLDAELVRDNLLHVAGSLDTKQGGPDIDFSDGESVARRSIYFRHAYEKQMTMLVLFDAAAPTECYRRTESIIPQQALVLANSPLAIDQSRILADRLSSSARDNVDFIEAAFETVLGRMSTEVEIAECSDFLKTQTKRLSEPKAPDAHRRKSFREVKTINDSIATSATESDSRAAEPQ